MSTTYGEPGSNARYTSGQVGWTIAEILRKFPEYNLQNPDAEPGPKYESVSHFFHEVMQNHEIARFRSLWHKWTAQGDESAGLEIKKIIDLIKAKEVEKVK